MSMTGMPSRIGYAFLQAGQMMRCSSKRRSPLQAGHTRIAFSSSSTMGLILSLSRADFRAEPVEGAAEAFFGFDARLPSEQGARARDVRLAHLRIVDGERLEDDVARGAGQPDDALRELEQRHHVGVADVH